MAKSNYKKIHRPISDDVSGITLPKKGCVVTVKQSKLSDEINKERLDSFNRSFIIMNDSMDRLLRTKKMSPNIMQKNFDKLDDLIERTEDYISENDISDELVAKYNEKLKVLTDKRNEVEQKFDEQCKAKTKAFLNSKNVILKTAQYNSKQKTKGYNNGNSR